MCDKLRTGTLILTLLLMVSIGASGQSTVINTVAGRPRVFPEGSLDPNAPLGTATAVTVDSSGNIFAADDFRSIIVKLSPDGVLRVVAGNGTRGFSGDDGPATSARLNLGGSGRLAVDGSGNLFIFDYRNGRIRKVTATGVITTVAAGLSGLSAGMAVGPAGDLFFTTGYRIRKLSPDGVISTVAGSGDFCFKGDGGLATQAGFEPSGITVDASGNLFITDTSFRCVSAFVGITGNRIRKVTPDGIISTIAGITDGSDDHYNGDGFPAILAALFQPSSVAVDALGNLFIADTGNYRIRKITPGGIISTVAGNGLIGFSGEGGPAATARLYRPQDVAVDGSGNILIADGADRYPRIRAIASNGIISTVIGNGQAPPNASGDGGPATSANLFAQGVATDAEGNIYIADDGNHRIRKVTPAGVISTVAGNGVAGFSGDGGPATNASLQRPQSVAVDGAGNIVIADTENNRVRKVSPAGIISTVGGGGGGVPGNFVLGGRATSVVLFRPLSVAVDSSGNIFAAESNLVQKITPDGTISTLAGRNVGPSARDGGLATNGSLQPKGVAVDSSGSLFIADSETRSVRKVTPDLIIRTVAGGAFSDSAAGGVGIAVDAAGNLYIPSGNVRKVTPDGIVSTVAGNGVTGFSGDGGPANGASLNGPSGVAVDSFGNLFIADALNYRVRNVGLLNRPSVNQGGTVNAGSFRTGLAAGSVGSLFGQDLASGTAVASAAPLPTTLSGATVEINGMPAPLFFVSPTQINFQVPWELQGQTQVSLTVAVSGSRGVAHNIALAPAAPGIFSLASSGSGQGAVQIANTSIFAAPAGTVPGAQARPVNRGESLTVYCTALGDVSNRPASGAPASANPLSVTTVTPSVTIGGQTVQASFSGLAPGFVGLYQVNVLVPANAATGDAVPLSITQGGIPSNSVTVAVR